MESQTTKIKPRFIGWEMSCHGYPQELKRTYRPIFDYENATQQELNRQCWAMLPYNVTCF